MTDTPAADFKSDAMPNIWTIDDKRTDDSRSSDDAHDDTSGVVTSDHLDDELEKPSFLRRLAKRYQQQQTDDETTDKNDDSRTK